MLVDKEIGHIQHYREKCKDDINAEQCEDYKNNIETDKSLWSVKDVVMKNVHETLLFLDLYD